MKEFMKKAHKRSHITDARLITAVVGLFLSVALHELFHILLHLGQISSIELFSDKHTIMQEIIVVPQGYNVALEEAVAYGITMIVMIATIIAVWNIHDTRHAKTPKQEIADIMEYAYSHGLLGKRA